MKERSKNLRIEKNMYAKSIHSKQRCDVPIKGIQKTTLIDYPGKIACTLFVGGCNLRCGYCYNADLVFNRTKKIPHDEIMAFLEQRREWLDGVCVTGGEPTVFPDVIRLCEQIKELGYKVKLDTNGTNPGRLGLLFDLGLLDYVAMDVKYSFDAYEKVTGVKVNPGKLRQSVSLIMESGIDYEFRTTVIPDMITKRIMKDIGVEVNGAKRFSLQQFRPTSTTLDEKYRTMPPVSKKRILELKEVITPFVGGVVLRGV